MKMQIEKEQPKLEDLAKTLDEKCFLYAISGDSQYQAHKLSEQIGYAPILAEIQKIVAENATKVAAGQGKISIPAAFRQKLRQLKSDAKEIAAQNKVFVDQREHRKEVKALKETGWQPHRDELWKGLEGYGSEEVKRAKRFLMQLRPMTGEPTLGEQAQAEDIRANTT